MLKDITSSDIFYMTWLVECYEYYEGQTSQQLYYEITQDLYDTSALYVTNTIENDNNFLNQIERACVMERYLDLEEYFKILANFYVHKNCIQFGFENVDKYYHRWVTHTADLVPQSIISGTALQIDIEQNCLDFKPLKFTKILRRIEDKGCFCNTISTTDFFNIEIQSELCNHDPFKKYKPTPIESASKNNDNKSYKIDHLYVKIDNLYDFAVGDVFDDSFTKSNFRVSVETADFSQLLSCAIIRRKKSKLFKIIKTTNSYLGDKHWYRDATKSVESTPTNCSGTNTSDWKWDEELAKL